MKRTAPISSAKSKKDYIPLPYLISDTIDAMSTWDLWDETILGQSSGYVHVSQGFELYAGFWSVAISPCLVN